MNYYIHYIINVTSIQYHLLYLQSTIYIIPSFHMNFWKFDFIKYLISFNRSSYNLKFSNSLFAYVQNFNDIFLEKSPSPVKNFENCENARKHADPLSNFRSCNISQVVSRSRSGFLAPFIHVVLAPPPPFPLLPFLSL